MASDGERRGVWRCARGVLTVAYEDGKRASWRVAFRSWNDDMLADATLWERL